MQNRKSTLITIIVLLILFIPLTIASTVLHFQNTNKEEDNPNHEFFYNGKLYFYDNQELLGTYTCESNDYCDYAISRNNFSYDLFEHQEETMDKINLINNRYAFLMDTTITNLKDAEIILYDLETSKELGRYKEVKNYGIGIDHNNYLVKNKEDMWGILQFYDGVNLKIPFAYTYMALADKKETVSNLISSDIISVLKENKWYLIDINDNKLTMDFADKIVSYNSQYVITNNGNTMRLSTYTGENILTGEYKYLNFCSKYLAVIDSNNLFYFYDLANKQEVGTRFTINNINDLHFEIEEEYIKVYNGNELIENVAIR